MKKITLALSALLLLSACSTSKGFPDDSVLYTIGDTSISKSNLYESMKKEDQSLSIYETMSNLIYGKIEIDEGTLNALVETEMEALKEVFKDELLTTIQSIGFKDVDTSNWMTKRNTLRTLSQQTFHWTSNPLKNISIKHKHQAFPQFYMMKKASFII